MVKDPERSSAKHSTSPPAILCTPNEIMKRANTLLLMRVGERPLIVKKLRYFTDKEVAGLFDAA